MVLLLNSTLHCSVCGVQCGSSNELFDGKRGDKGLLLLDGTPGQPTKGVSTRWCEGPRGSVPRGEHTIVVRLTVLHALRLATRHNSVRMQTH